MAASYPVNSCHVDPVPAAGVAGGCDAGAGSTEFGGGEKGRLLDHGADAVVERDARARWLPLPWIRSGPVASTAVAVLRHRPGVAQAGSTLLAAHNTAVVLAERMEVPARSTDAEAGSRGKAACLRLQPGRPALPSPGPCPLLQRGRDIVRGITSNYRALTPQSPPRRSAVLTHDHPQPRRRAAIGFNPVFRRACVKADCRRIVEIASLAHVDMPSARRGRCC